MHERAERPLGQHLHRLRIAEGLGERVDVEVLDGVAEVRVGLVRVVRPTRRGRSRTRGGAGTRPGSPPRSPRTRSPETVGSLGTRALGRVGEDALAVVGRVERVAVGDVELGAEVRVERLDRRVLVVAGERGEDRVVGGRRVLLPALRIQDQLGRRVVVLLELEVDPCSNRPSIACVSGSGTYGSGPR